MKMEGNFNTPANVKKEIPQRLWLANEAMIKLAVGNIEISGKENINKIPPGAKIVVMGTHLSDIDMPIIIHSIAKDLDVVVANMSVHHKMFGDQSEASTNIGMRIAGKDNFLPLDFKINHKVDEKGNKYDDKSAKPFNPENFKPMIEVMEKGKAVLIAAHNPSEKPAKNLDGVKEGYGGVYLAELVDAYILPVTVILDKDAGMHGDELNTLKEKPNATVSIGEPFKLEKVEGIEHFSEFTKKRENGEILNNEEMTNFSRLAGGLRDRSKEVIKKMSDQISK